MLASSVCSVYWVSVLNPAVYEDVPIAVLDFVCCVVVDDLAVDTVYIFDVLLLLFCHGIVLLCGVLSLALSK